MSTLAYELGNEIMKKYFNFRNRILKSIEFKSAKRSYAVHGAERIAGDLEQLWRRVEGARGVCTCQEMLAAHDARQTGVRRRTNKRNNSAIK